MSSRHWPTDDYGVLLNVGNHAALTRVFEPLIKEAVNSCIHAIEADLHSIYVIGSIARGDAQPGYSDFDLVGVLEYSVDPELVKQDWIASAMQTLSERHSVLINGVEFDLWPQGYIFRDPTEFSPGAFLLATQSVCVWGSDLVPELPRYSLRHLPTLRAIANEDLLYLSDDLHTIGNDLSGSHEDGPLLSRELGKKLARAGFALALEHNRQYARDVATCAADFCRVYPTHAEDMQQALTLYTQPVRDGGAIWSILNGFGVWLRDAADAWLDAHNPDRDEFYLVGDAEEDPE